jgi:tetratricopeptide (TPR) repeat protein
MSFGRWRGTFVLVVGLLSLLVAGCAPLPPIEPMPKRGARAPSSAPNAVIAAKPRIHGRPTPTPTHVSAAILEEEVSELPEPIQPDQPPPGMVADSDGNWSLEPQIKAAKAPNTAAALRMIDKSRLLIDQQKYDEALDNLQRAVSVDPANFYGYYYLAKAHREANDYSQAIAFANRATALGARAERIWLARAYTLQGEIFEQVGRFSDARTAYQRAVNTDPTNLAAYVGKNRVSPQLPPPTPIHEDPGY